MLRRIAVELLAARAPHPRRSSRISMAATKASQGELAAAAASALPQGCPGGSRSIAGWTVLPTATDSLSPCTGLVDIGANLADKAFAADLPEVLQRAADAGVRAAVVTGCSQQSSRAAQALCQQPGPLELYFTAGVHPHESGRDWSGAAAASLRELAADARCVAIGECGLDFNRDFSPRSAQEACFEAQVRAPAGRGLMLERCTHRTDAFVRRRYSWPASCRSRSSCTAETPVTPLLLC